MIIDFRQLDNGTEIEADVCIIGAGAAGITLAGALRGSGVQVCLLESGGYELNEEIQSLYRGEKRGLPYWELHLARLRYFGGSTNHWGGWCGPLDESDFEARPWVPHSGWPIRRQALDAYYPAAQALCELGPYRYGIADWEDDARRFPDFHPAKLHAQLWQFSPPTRFGTVYRRELGEAGNIRAYLYANVTELETDENASRVLRAQIRTPGVTRGRCGPGISSSPAAG
ncbi:FAD-dependent oxidoreductase [Marinobacterium aestuariivivens]|uniref:FAD-dependent monooxygenase n=1 Tax=Marinobacterium aestuariivivens TaxID=1698799 RepID=A0ABW2A2X4_9GAMM